jgi:hypothetical protein
VYVNTKWELKTKGKGYVLPLTLYLHVLIQQATFLNQQRLNYYIKYRYSDYGAYVNTVRVTSKIFFNVINPELLFQKCSAIFSLIRPSFYDIGTPWVQWPRLFKLAAFLVFNKSHLHVDTNFLST